MSKQREYFCVYCGGRLDEDECFCGHCGKLADFGAGSSTSTEPKVKPTDEQQEEGKKPVLIIIGIVLMFLQLLSFIGNAKNGNTISLSLTDGLSVFLYDFVGLLAYCLVGIFGLLFFVMGIAKDEKRRGAIAAVICGVFFVIYFLLQY